MEHHRIGEHELSFDPLNHQYFVDGKAVVSISQIVDESLPKTYKNVDPEILQKAAEKGNTLRHMIDCYETDGLKTYHPEMQGYIALKSEHQIDVQKRKVFVILFHHGLVIAAGRFDMVVSSPYMRGKGIAQIKRMAHFDEERVMLQMNLYRLAYGQTYKQRIDYLKCIHIRNRYRQYVDIALNQATAKQALEQYVKKNPVNYDDFVSTY